MPSRGGGRGDGTCPRRTRIRHVDRARAWGQREVGRGPGVPDCRGIPGQRPCPAAHVEGAGGGVRRREQHRRDILVIRVKRARREQDPVRVCGYEGVLKNHRSCSVHNLWRKQGRDTRHRQVLRSASDEIDVAGGRRGHSRGKRQ